MAYKVYLRRKQSKEAFWLARGGTAEGARPLRFPSMRAAQRYAERLKSFETRIRKSPARNIAKQIVRKKFRPRRRPTLF